MSELIFGPGPTISNPPWWKMATARLFGKKTVSVDGDYKMTAYTWRGVTYVKEFKQNSPKIHPESPWPAPPGVESRADMLRRFEEAGIISSRNDLLEEMAREAMGLGPKPEIPKDFDFEQMWKAFDRDSPGHIPRTQLEFTRFRVRNPEVVRYALLFAKTMSLILDRYTEKGTNPMSEKEMPKYVSRDTVHAIKIAKIVLDTEGGETRIYPLEAGYDPITIRGFSTAFGTPQVGGYLIQSAHVPQFMSEREFDANFEPAEESASPDLKWALDELDKAKACIAKLETNRTFLLDVIRNGHKRDEELIKEIAQDVDDYLATSGSPEAKVGNDPKRADVV